MRLARALACCALSVQSWHHDIAGLQGLRTLAIGTRELDEEWVTEWDANYQEAASLLEGRDEATEKLIAEVEQDLELVGVSAIEDKLQDGVPAAIQTLLDAGIKVRVRASETCRTASQSCDDVQDSALLRQPVCLLHGRTSATPFDEHVCVIA